MVDKRHSLVDGMLMSPFDYAHKNEDIDNKKWGLGKSLPRSGLPRQITLTKVHCSLDQKIENTTNIPTTP